MTKCDVEVDSR